MTEYVLGFYFNQPKTRVVLIQKKRPAWQAGKLNGVGGHIEPGETPIQAMHREFLEEAGISCFDWVKFAEMCFPDAIVHCFTASGPLDGIHTASDELIYFHFVESLPDSILPNLRWLIPLALSGDSVAIHPKTYDDCFSFRDMAVTPLGELVN